MTAQHKTEKAIRLSAYAAALARWHKLNARSVLGTSMLLKARS